MIKIRKFIILILLTFLICCKPPSWQTLEITSNENNLEIVLKGRYWKSMFDPDGAFEICISNTGHKDLVNCYLILDEKYEHSIKGLHIKREKNTDTLFSGESFNILFCHDTNNHLIFEIKDSDFWYPSIVEFVCSSGKVKCKLDK